MPWAKSFCPFRACCLYPLPWAKSIWAFSPYLNHLRMLNKESTLKSSFWFFSLQNVIWLSDGYIWRNYQKWLFQVGSWLKFRKFCPTRPEGAEALSPGQRPGLSCSQTWRPVRAKALKLLTIYKAFAPSGRAACIHCPGLRASAPSIIFALGKIKRWKSLYLQIIVNFAGK